MSNQRLEIDTAPRTAEELAQFGRFRVKDLAMKIGMGDDSDARAALAQMNIQDLATSVASRLVDIDKNGGAPATTEPAPEPEVAEPAAEAAAEPAKKPAKKPRKTNNAGTAAPVDLSPVLAEISALKDALGVLGSAAKAQQQVIEALIGKLEGLDYNNKLGMALSLFFAEEQLGGTRPEILKSAMDDVDSIGEMLGEAMAKKG